MRSRISSTFMIAMAALTLAATHPLSVQAQAQTVGLFQYDSAAYPGYTLLDAMVDGNVYLIDMWGREVHHWQSAYQPAASVYLLPDGDLLRTVNPYGGGGGKGGQLERFSWDGTLEWKFVYDDSLVRAHHDIEPLPNGNVLILAWEYLTAAEAVAAGRDPAGISGATLAPEHVIEVQPVADSGGIIVWEWHVWDHLIQDFDSTKANFGVVEDHPELVDVNYRRNGGSDWLHGNALAYNPDLDQIAISANRINELWVIDHSTMTAEAASHTGGNSGMGGDILYRWGNPEAYRRGTAADQVLYAQHDVHWVSAGLPGEGNIMIFNNGGGRPDGDYTTIEEIAPPVDAFGNYAPLSPGEAHGPATTTWKYGAVPPTDWFSRFISGSQRLPNGNTLICSGAHGRFFEVTPDSQIVWDFVSPAGLGGPLLQGDTTVNIVFRAPRYLADYGAFAGRDMTPGSLIEIYPLTISGTAHSPASPTRFDSVAVTSTITDVDLITLAELHVDTGGGFVTVPMFDDGAHHDGLAGDDLYGAVVRPVSSPMTAAYYVTATDDTDSSATDPANPPSTVYWYTVTGDCDCPSQADFNDDGFVDSVDLSILIDVVFFGVSDIQDSWCTATRGDFDGNGVADSVDLSLLIDHVFFGGPGPADPCGP